MIMLIGTSAELHGWLCRYKADTLVTKVPREIPPNKVSKYIVTFLSLVKRNGYDATDTYNIWKNCPVRKNGFIVFRISGLQAFFQNQGATVPANNILHQELQKLNCVSKQLRIKGRVVTALWVPQSVIGEIK